MGDNGCSVLAFAITAWLGSIAAKDISLRENIL
jgi:hypothetical protein